jgi:hypothetical protein
MNTPASPAKKKVTTIGITEAQILLSERIFEASENFLNARLFEASFLKPAKTF